MTWRLIAEVDLAAQAVGALAAVDGGVEGDAIAGREVTSRPSRRRPRSRRLRVP